mgnify:CR=1 FL=1
MNITEARAKLIAQEQELHQLRREVAALRRQVAGITQPQEGLDALARYDAARVAGAEVCDDVE